jgi:FkbM family methyltransferase
VGAWDSPGKVRLFVNDSHPASSFVEGGKTYRQERLSEFRYVEVPVDTLDNLLEHHRLQNVSLVSITTNGSERRILGGLSETIRSGLPFISLARTGGNYKQFMGELGYTFVCHDDRGYTFSRESD